MMSSRTVLMISYAFPPCSEAGVFRTLRFVRYLPEFGWNPVVLTAKNGVFTRRDEKLREQVPAGLTVIKARNWELGAIAGQLVSYREKSTPSQRGEGGNHRGAPFWDLARRVYRRADVWMIPDRKIGWIPGAVWQALAYIRRHRVNALYSSGGPWSAHLIASILKKITGLPWVADYRDYWTLSPVPELNLPRARLKVEELLEHALMRHSDLNLFVNERTRNSYVARYPDLSPSRFRCLTNGFEPADFADASGKCPSGELMILHAGAACTSAYALGPFFQALRQWLDLHPEAQSKLRIRFIGELGNNAKFISQYGLSQIVSDEAPISHGEITTLMQTASVLLVVLGDHPPETRASKTLEYLAAGRPIWAVAVEGATAEIVRASGCGWISHPRKIEEIHTSLDQIWAAFCQGDLTELRPDPKLVAQFDGRRLTGQLADWLDEINSPHA